MEDGRSKNAMPKLRASVRKELERAVSLGLDVGVDVLDEDLRRSRQVL